MRILVTGAGGFLGRSVVRTLLRDGRHQVVAQVRQKRSVEIFLGDPSTTSVPEIVTTNLLQEGDTDRILADVEVVVHCAANMRGSPADMYFNTVVATQRLLNSIGRAKTVRRLVLVSSFAVYGPAILSRDSVMNEATPLEAHPEWRDGYVLSKLHQERVAREVAAKSGLELVVLRPGVIYGPGGSAFSNRVGVSMFGWFLHLGGRNLLPLSYVENCADAVALAATVPEAAERTFNVHDDELPTCRQYLKRYQQEVGDIRAVRIPYWALMLVSRVVDWYHHKSKGQLPAAFTPYATRTLYVGRKYDNSQLHSLGWRQAVGMEAGLARLFAYLKIEKH